MKLTKLAQTELHQTKEVTGLLSCRIDYEIKAGKGQLDYTGPKFAPAMWHQVLSFFRWTNQEMNSESQVRLYVNLKLGRWGAWAFPQEARTGMSARELVSPETPEQAVARFASWEAEPSGDWLYFCTVHHHCAVSAFQSGTDEANEKNQDGLHLTVGRLDADRHDLHARFYLNGNCFAPDLSGFWPLAPALVAQLPATSLDDVARFQMGEKVVVDFPDAWRRNVIETKRQARTLASNVSTDLWHPSPLERPVWIRVEHALQEIALDCEAAAVGEADYLMALQSLTGNPVIHLILEICQKYQVLPADLLGELEPYEAGF